MAVVLAAGRGQRFGGERAKQFADLGGRPVVSHSVQAFAAHPAIDAVWVVGPNDQIAALRDVTSGLADRYIVGGAERTDSVRSAVDEINPTVDRIVIHDAARPLLAAGVISRVVAALDEADAVATVLPVADTVIEMIDGRIRTPDRARMFQLQTPQGFRAGVLSEAHRRAEGVNFTDDVSLVIAMCPDAAVTTVAGDRLLHKVTTPEDLTLLAAQLPDPRT